MVETTMLSQSNIEKIVEFANLAHQDDTYEMECIIARYIKHSPGTSKDTFMRVLNMCRTKSCQGSNWKSIKERSKTLDISIIDTHYRITILGEHNINLYLRTDSLKDLEKGSWYVLEKERIPGGHGVHDMDELPVACRVTLKRELPVEQNDAKFAMILANWDNHLKTFRCKNRYSYLYDDKYSVDLTAVRGNTFQAKKIRQSTALTSREQYEIEIEYVPDICKSLNNENCTFDIDSWQTLFSTILCSYLDTWKLSHKSILKDVEHQYYSVISGNREHDIKISKNYLYKLGPQVVSLSLQRLIDQLQIKSKSFYVCPKSDGLRMTGFIHDDGELYLLGSRSSVFQPTGIMFSEERKYTVFDGELCTKNKNTDEDISHYLIFDCYWNNDEDIRQKPFSERLQICDDIMNDLIEVKTPDIKGHPLPQIKTKSFIPCDDLFESCKKCFYNIDIHIYENDGLIFTPNESVGGDLLWQNANTNKFVKTGVEFQKMLKWKDTTFNSIDFKVDFLEDFERPVFNNGDSVLMKFKSCKLSVLVDEDEQKEFTANDYLAYSRLSVTEKNKLHNQEKTPKKRSKANAKEFVPMYPIDSKAAFVKLPVYDGRVRCKDKDDWSGSAISDGDIVEMVYDVDAEEEYRWTPIRIRKDKTEPNHFKVAQDIWKSYYVPVTKDMMIGNQPIPSSDDTNDVYYNTESKKGKDPIAKFHRLVVKDSIFQDTLSRTEGKTLLDLGSGQAGDLPRYLKYNARKVVGIDNSVDNLHRPGTGAYSRLRKSCFENKWDVSDNMKYLFAAADAGKSLADTANFHGMYKQFVDTHKSHFFAKKHTFDVATVFFAIHYFFKDITTLRSFIQNVADNVKVGGYFGGCCYDGNIIHEKLKTNDGMDLVFPNEQNNEMIRIIKNYEGDFDDSVESVGKEINVLVQSINTRHSEYLVNFDRLRYEMYFHGFELESSNNFEHYYNERQGTDPLSLSTKEQEASLKLNRVFIFKRVAETHEQEQINIMKKI